MSRDIIVQDIPIGVASIAEIPDMWTPAALPYTQADVVAAVIEIAPSTDISDPQWLRVNLPGVSIEVNARDESPLYSFALHIRGEDAPANVFVSRLLAKLGSRAFDVDSASGLFEH